MKTIKIEVKEMSLADELLSEREMQRTNWKIDQQKISKQMHREKNENGKTKI